MTRSLGCRIFGHPRQIQTTHLGICISSLAAVMYSGQGFLISPTGNVDPLKGRLAPARVSFGDVIRLPTPMQRELVGAIRR